VAIPLLNYAPTTQNSRVAGYEIPGDEQAKIYSTENLLSGTDMDNLIEAAYRQIFFHAFKRDRQTFLESQLRSGQITVRDFVRGLLLSDTYLTSFYNMNSNYRFVQQCVQRVLGRDSYSEQEKIAWSIVVATKGVRGFVDALLDSQEYLDAFGYDTLPYQRRRSLPSRTTGETPFNIQSPRYNEYYRTILGFPRAVWQNSVKRFTPQEQQASVGSPANFLEMARSIAPTPGGAPSVSVANINIATQVPYRQI
jgi:phycobilisome rod-core linker protein